MPSQLVRALTTLGMALAMTLGLTSLAAPSSASTGGIEDRTNKYSNVGLLVFYSDGARYRCSGTLVSPRVVLTAGHCTDETDGKTAVTFAPVIAGATPATESSGTVRTQLDRQFQ